MLRVYLLNLGTNIEGIENHATLYDNCNNVMNIDCFAAVIISMFSNEDIVTLCIKSYSANTTHIVLKIDINNSNIVLTLIKTISGKEHCKRLKNIGLEIPHRIDYSFPWTFAGQYIILGKNIIFIQYNSFDIKVMCVFLYYTLLCKSKC